MPYKYRDIKKRLIKLGFTIVRQKGAHVIFSNGKSTFPVPNHGAKDISVGVEKQILRILALSDDDFKNLV